MTIKEIKKDIFTMPNDYALAHCISADFALGAGIAKEFDRRFNCRKHLFNLMGGNNYIEQWDYLKIAKCIAIRTFEPPTVFNLVTKRNYWNKPTLTTIKEALEDMCYQCGYLQIKKLAIPQLGCGLDRLDWSDVRTLIKEVFDDTDIEIVVCNL